MMGPIPFEGGSPYSVVCPVCRAVKGGKCLEKIKDGSKYIDTPHVERVDLAGQQ